MEEMKQSDPFLPTEETPYSLVPEIDGRCTYTWTPKVLEGVVYPAVRCTRRAGTEHKHEWRWAEEEKWQRA